MEVPEERVNLRVAFCNYRYFVSGGPERYLFSLKDVLEQRDHQVLPFSVAYEQNRATPYSRYFVSPPGRPDQVYFRDLTLSFPQKVRFGLNTVYSLETRRKMDAFLRAENPDLVHTFQINTYLSYSLLDACYHRGVPVVSRMSTFQLICPMELFFRDGKVCEACKKTILSAVRYRCIQNSLPASLLRVAGLGLFRWTRFFRRINAFMVPSRFLGEKMVEYGFPRGRIHHIPSFLDTREIRPVYKNQGYILYFGRIAPEKGVMDLVRAYERLKPRQSLKVVGDIGSPEAQRIRSYVKNRGIPGITFYDFMDMERLRKVIEGALFTVCPSIWYENTPMSVYESLALGKPVIGSRLGSLPEQILEGRTGLLFQPGEADDLAEKMAFFLSHSRSAVEMGKEGRRMIEEKHSPDVHYRAVHRLYRHVLKSRRG
jgi:glycosyltransferase involved in cell wall biosynthesis